MSDCERGRKESGREPRYPAAGPDGKVAPPPMISNRTMALAPLVLIAATPAWSGDAPGRPEIVAVEPSPQERKKAVERLTESEVEGLVGSLTESAARLEEVDGFAAPRLNTLTELEVKALLAGFLKKNGFDVAAGKLAGVEFDAVDAKRRVGVKVLDPKAALDEIAVLKARGEARLLVLDASTPYGFSGLPTKRGAVHALLAELERFLNE